MRIYFAILFLLSFLFSQTVQSQDGTLKKVNFLPLWVPQPQFAGYYMAKEKGIYKKYGLDVNIINGGYKKEVPVYLKEGKADFGIMYLSSALKERADSMALINIGQIFQRSEIMFVAKKTSGINRIQDFAGKKIAVWRTVLNDLTIGFLKKHHIDAEVIRINEGVNMFVKGGVDICAVMYYNEYNTLINFGIDPDELNVFYFRDYGINLPEDGIYCMESTYSKDPDLCAKFVQASIEGWQYALSHQDETLDVIKRVQKQENEISNRPHSEWMLKAMKDLIQPPGKNTPTGKLEEEDYHQTVQFLLNNNAINTSTQYTIFYRGAIK